MMIKTIQFVLFLVLGNICAQAQVTVNSLQALLPYLDDDNANVILAPGTYTVTVNDVNNGMYTKTNHNGKAVLFMIEGSNSTYDFTDVTIEVQTGVFAAFGNIDVHEFNIYGSNNVLKNLKLVDVGSVYDAPRKGALNIAIDGKNNVVEGFDVESKGSYPYGYGDIFGKGGGSLIGLQKHSGILIRGNYNTLRDTKIFHQAFGHCVFMQAASNPTIDGCYIRGEIRTTDDILEESGTGTVADDLGFMTTWGYTLPEGFMLALCEAGIRSYNAGSTMVDGVIYERGSNDITVNNTTVVNTRSGCTISQASGSRTVTNCTLIGNESGYAIGSGTITNCTVDAAYGPAFDGGSGITADVTLIEPENGYYNGSKAIASVTGADLTLNSNGIDVPSDLNIKMGTIRDLRHQIGGTLDYQLVTSFSGATVNNLTNAAIELGVDANNNTIITCGIVDDRGSNNTISEGSNCSVAVSCNNTTENLEAECYDAMSGVVIEDIVGGINEQAITSIHGGDWISFEDVDLTDVASVKIIASSTQSGSSVEIRSGSITGTVLATLPITNTSGAYQEFTTDLSQINNGIINVYCVFTGTSSDELFKLDKVNFIQPACLVSSYTGGETTRAVDFCEASDVQVQGSLPEIVGFINDGDYLRFSNYDFGGGNLNSIRVLTSSKTSGGTIEVRTGGVDGELWGSVPVGSTGNWNTYQEYEINLKGEINGVQDLYLVFTGDDGYLFNFQNFEFYVDECLIPYNIGEITSAADFCEASDVEIEGISVEVVGFINNGDYIRFPLYDFGNTGNYNNIRILASSRTSGGTVELRTDGVNGDLLASVDIENTGSWNEYEAFESSFTEAMTGMQDLYLVFTGIGDGFLFNFESFQFFNNTLSLDEIGFSKNQISIYPNPTQSNLSVNLSNHMNTSVDYVISAIDGRQIKSGSWAINHQSTIELDLDNLQNGMYILQVKPLDNTDAKIIKFVVSN